MTAASPALVPRRISVVAERPLVRGALAAALTTADLIVEATNLDSARDRDVLVELNPAVVVVNAGEDNTLTLGRMTAAVARLVPRARILVLAESDEEGPLLDAFAHGADGYLAMTSSLDDLERTVRMLAGGRSTVDRDRLSRLVRAHADDQTHNAAHAPGVTGLTQREDEVLHMLADGATTNAIAGKLAIAPATVRSHVHNLLDKLGVHSRLAAVAQVLDLGG